MKRRRFLSCGAAIILAGMCRPLLARIAKFNAEIGTDVMVKHGGLEWNPTAAKCRRPRPHDR